MNKECKNCIKRKTIWCPNSDKCYSKEDKPYYINELIALQEIETLRNIINIKNDYVTQLHNLIYRIDNPNLQFALYIKQEKYLKELKENNKK